MISQLTKHKPDAERNYAYYPVIFKTEAALLKAEKNFSLTCHPEFISGSHKSEEKTNFLPRNKTHELEEEF